MTTMLECIRYLYNLISVLTANPSALFQIHLVGVERCREWISDVRLDSAVVIYWQIEIVSTQNISSLMQSPCCDALMVFVPEVVTN